MLRLPALMAAAIVACSSISLAAERPHIASHPLGFSGATVSIRESYDQTQWPVAEQTLILKGANGNAVIVALHHGGGVAGNNSFNLFKAYQDRFLVVSERDCVDFDPVKVTVMPCRQRPACTTNASGARTVVGAIYLGRFDWMNGFDPPRRAFGLDWRFGPLEDTLESGSCPIESRK